MEHELKLASGKELGEEKTRTVVIRVKGVVGRQRVSFRRVGGTSLAPPQKNRRGVSRWGAFGGVKAAAAAAFEK